MEVAALHVHVDDSSAAGAARRDAIDLAQRVGLDETEVGKVALIVTESATNLVNHAGGGELVVTPIENETLRGIDIVAVDRGPGIANVAHALRDGFSTTGTAGNGLGAMARLSSEFDMYSRPGRGTAIFARIHASAAPAAPAARTGFTIAGLNVPFPGESVSGDHWVVHRDAGRAMVLVIDGLGHGHMANEAARAAAATFAAHPTGAPLEILERIHVALRPTRGAAVVVVEIDPVRHLARCAGIGNIAGTIMQNGSTRSMVLLHGTAGHQARHLQEFQYPWPVNATLVLHSDGLHANWILTDYPGLAARHPMLTAAVLYRDFRRGRDDTTVVVLREAA